MPDPFNIELPAAAKPRLSRRFRVLRPLEIAPDSKKKGSYYYYTDDHVRALVSDLGQCSSSSTRRRAAKKLRKLAKHSPENRLRIAGLGAVQALVSTLVHLQFPYSDDDQTCSASATATDDAELHEHAITALYNLSLHDSNMPLIASSGAFFPAIITTLASPYGTPAAKSGAACLLLRLAQHIDVDSNVEVYMLEDLGSHAIPLLMDLLRNEELRCQKDAATALYELTSRCPANRVFAARARLVPAVLELMEDPGSCMVEKAAYVLSAVVQDCGEAKDEVLECGGVGVLAEMIELGTRVQKEIAINVLVRVCTTEEGEEEKQEHYCRLVGAEEGALSGLLAVAEPASGCSSRSRRKAKFMYDLLRLHSLETTGSPPATNKSASSMLKVTAGSFHVAGGIVHEAWRREKSRVVKMTTPDKREDHKNQLNVLRK